jgi:methylmalonyl-CoA carboxyltransferase 5S subunit
MLDGTGFSTDLDEDKLLATKDYFAGVRPRYAEFLSGITGVETEIFKSQIPGGMISNMESQLRQQGAGDKLKEVLLEVPRVREDAGYPPLVTPSSQIVGTQAVFNVLMGRYKVMTAEFADLMLGYYGRTLGEYNPEVVELAHVQTKKEPITQRPADLLPPEWDELKAQALAVPGCNGSDEDVLTHAMFPKVAESFFSTRPDGPKNLGRDPREVAAEKAAAAGANGSGTDPVRTPITYKVTVNGMPHSVSVAPA